MNSTSIEDMKLPKQTCVPRFPYQENSQLDNFPLNNFHPDNSPLGQFTIRTGEELSRWVLT